MKTEVGIIMGSTSDWETMSHACAVLDELNIPYEKKVVSAHRTPDLMFEYAETAKQEVKSYYRGRRRFSTSARYGSCKNGYCQLSESQLSLSH